MLEKQVCGEYFIGDCCGLFWPLLSNQVDLPTFSLKNHIPILTVFFIDFRLDSRYEGDPGSNP